MVDLEFYREVGLKENRGTCTCWQPQFDVCKKIVTFRPQECDTGGLLLKCINEQCRCQGNDTWEDTGDLMGKICLPPGGTCIVCFLFVLLP